MIKFKQGSVTNPKTGVTTDIVVKAPTTNKVRDILIGGGLILVGVTHLTRTAFRRGAVAYEVAEFVALKDADLIGEVESDEG